MARTRRAPWDYERIDMRPVPYTATCPACGSACYRIGLPDGIIQYGCPKCGIVDADGKLIKSISDTKERQNELAESYSH